ncbi:hypothetical protein A0H81_10562 [Grifola frondosa]|uniref:BRCT domain-containing protein n=1 Tax=Grifola frondosa TaxID=5627 RepID=A0A1C7LYH8_GRIFR|nr:hypothetical protein A0H81_10562 [Grifola frondosa]
MGMGRGKGKEREKSTDVRKRDASRRASLASQFLSQSLTALPYTPAPLDPAKAQRQAPHHVWHEEAIRPLRGAWYCAALLNGGGTGAHVSAHPRRPAGLKDGDMNTSPAGGALAVLLACTIFVDVRTDEGDDAGALFVDMLKGMGARITSRVGQRCTHIVYKNGLMSTLTRYRLLNEPKPHVVGIAWVVECVEQRARVDEARFIIDLAGMNVAGTNKRRRSMLPKQLLRVDSGSSSIFSPGSSDFADTNGGPRLAEVSSSRMAVDDEGDSIESIGVGLSDDSLPPLEKARRRRSMLPIRSALQGS